MDADNTPQVLGRTVSGTTPPLAKPIILCALSVELRAIRDHLNIIGCVRHLAGTVFELGTLVGTGQLVIAAMTGPGNHAAAVIAERAIAQFNPDVLLFVGIAGSLRPDIRLGDVVVATRVYAYQGGQAAPAGFLCSPRSWETSHEWCQRAQYVDLTGAWRARLAGPAGVTVPRVHFAAIAAGEVVLNHRRSALAHQLRRNYSDAAAIEMESAGMAQAAHLNGRLPAITIRGIADCADGDKYRNDAAGWQSVAAGNAAAFAMALVEAQWHCGAAGYRAR